jgi:hypothetical protein
MPKRRRRSPLKDYFFPHRGNRYKPSIFAASSVLAIVAAVLVLEGAYLGSTRYLFPNTGFLASVLPGVLADLTNQDRAAADAPPVAIDPLLSQAAQDKANDMAAKGYFSHVTPDGKQPWYWISLVGYQYTYAGENLAVNFTDSTAVEQAWMASPTHHANIVKPQYTKVGFGVAEGQYQGKDATFVVEFFATPPADEAAAGAASAKPGASLAATPKAETETRPAQTASAPASAPEVAAASAAPTTTAVLGAEVSPPQAPAALGFFGAIATSPEHTLIYMLSGLIALMAILLLIAVFVKLRIQYREVITGGLAVMLVALALLIFTKTTATQVVIPADTQSAAVYQALGA